MSNINEQSKHVCSTDSTKQYLIRWVIALFLSLLFIAIRMLMNAYGVINNVYRAYFNLSYYIIDWFTLAQVPGIMISSLILAKLSFSGVTGFRRLCIILALCAIAACGCMMTSFIVRSLFELIFVGNFLLGLGYVAGYAIMSSFATSWFPEDQIGLALSLRSASMALGSLLAFLIPTQIVNPPPFDHNNNFGALRQKNIAYDVIKTNYSGVTQDIDTLSFNTTSAGNRNGFATDQKTSLSTNNAMSLWKEQTGFRLFWFYGVLLLICAVVFLFTLMFIADQPPQPPSTAQALFRSQQGNSPTIFGDMKEFLLEIKLFLYDQAILQIVIANSVIHGINFMQKLLMAEILREVFIRNTHASQLNATTGYTLLLYEAGSVFGSIIGGKILDCYKKHTLTALLGISLSTASIMGIILGYYFMVIEVIFVFNTVLGIALAVAHTPLLDMLLQHTYPKNPGMIMVLMFAVMQIPILFISQTSRWILNLSGGIAVLMYLCAMSLGVLLTIPSIDLSHNRLNASNCDPQNEENSS